MPTKKKAQPEAVEQVSSGERIKTSSRYSTMIPADKPFAIPLDATLIPDEYQLLDDRIKIVGEAYIQHGKLRLPIRAVEKGYLLLDGSAELIEVQSWKPEERADDE